MAILDRSGLEFVEATLLGLVLGGTIGVAIGLLTVALCHYLGVARLTSIVAYESNGLATCTDMYPAFGKALYSKPREATGKIVFPGSSSTQR